MKLNKLKLEVVLETGNLSESFTGLADGLKSHGVEFTPQLSEFLIDWFRCNTVANVHGRTIELLRRLSQYECIHHEWAPEDGCDGCDKHHVDEECKSP